MIFPAASWVADSIALDEALMQEANAPAICLGMTRARDQEISLLRQAIVRYGDKARMGTVEPMALQQAIDRAFEAQP
ncbi:MAG: hypothetical protein ABJN42_24815 [Roseibium sp.]|uniref:hypothetical protein n=1 Tax=Roseibium sp. TaxID=1936156 RepID=UPI003299C59F